MAFEIHLQLKILRTWMLPTFMLILSWVNIMKRKWIRCVGSHLLNKNASLLFEEHCTKAFHVLLYFSFSLKRRFQIQPTVDRIISSTIYLPFFSFFLNSAYLGAHPVPRKIFIRTSKVLMRVNV